MVRILCRSLMLMCLFHENSQFMTLISRPLGEAEASSTSIGVDVDAGSTGGATVGLVSMVGSWTEGLALTGVGASDSWAARPPNDGGAVEHSSTVMVGF